MYALAGLAAACCKHAAGLDEDTARLAADVPEHMSQSEGPSLYAQSAPAQLLANFVILCVLLVVIVVQGHWLTMVCDTLLCIADEGYKPQGRIFAMCGQVGSSFQDVSFDIYFIYHSS